MIEDRSSVLVIIEGDPVGKGRPKASSRGGFVRMYTPAKTRDYEDMVREEAARSMGPREPFECPCLVEMSLVCGIPASWSKVKREQALAGRILPTKKPDVDNVLKAVCDSFNGVVWRDDVLATDFIIRKRFGPSPHVEVRVSPLAPAAM